MKRQKQATIYWARNNDGLPLHISNAEQGLKCNATCYQCHQSLIARQGQIKQHTFAHESLTDCSGESAVHALAKYLLATRSQPLTLPRKTVEATHTDVFGASHHLSTTLFKSPIRLCNVRLEHQVSPQLRPDCVATILETGEEIAIEVHFRHRKDEVDVETIRALDISSVEIDLSAVHPSASLEEIADAVFEMQPRNWLHYSKASEKMLGVHQELSKNVMKINDEAMAFLKEARHSFELEALLACPTSFNWPSFQESAGASVANKVFRLSRINSEWAPIQDGYSVACAIVEGFNIPCPVALTIYRVEDKARLSNGKFHHAGPYLEVVALLQSKRFSHLRILQLTWFGIDGWKKALLQEAQNLEDIRIAAENAERAKAIQLRLQEISSGGAALWSKLPWPSISASYGSKTVHMVPRVHLTGKSWRETPKGWVNEGITQTDMFQEESVVVVARPWNFNCSYPTYVARSTKKYLLLEFDIPLGSNATSPFNLRWAGIANWEDTLYLQAKKQHREQDAEAALTILNSVGDIFLLSGAAKTKRAFDLLALTVAPRSGDPDAPAWRCFKQCWQALAIKYCLLGRPKGALITPADIAQSPILNNLLSLEVDYDSMQRREQGAHAWLEHLARSGYIQRAGTHYPGCNRQPHYEIKALPNNLGLLL